MGQEYEGVLDVGGANTSEIFTADSLNLTITSQVLNYGLDKATKIVAKIDILYINQIIHGNQKNAATFNAGRSLCAVKFSFHISNDIYFFAMFLIILKKIKFWLMAK